MLRRRQLMAMQTGGWPGAYKQVEWIGNPNGTAYLNIGVNYTLGQNAECIIDAIGYDDTISNTFLCGWNTGFAVNAYRIESDGYARRFGNGAITIQNSDTLTRTKIVLTIGQNKRTVYTGYVNGVQQWSAQRGASSLEYYPTIFPIFCRIRKFNGKILFGQNVGKFKVFNFTFAVDDEPQAELIPCVRKSDNKPGMYDTVSKTFYTNAGTGEFIVPN